MSISAGALTILQDGLRQAPELTRRELHAAATEATMLLEREVKENIPTGATGLTRGSVTSDVLSTPAGVLGVVGSSQPSALFVEAGTRPHMPPPQALVPWVRSVLGLGEKDAKSAAFAIALKIRARGTKAQRPFQRALDAREVQVVGMFEAAADRIAQQLPGATA